MRKQKQQPKISNNSKTQTPTVSHGKENSFASSLFSGVFQGFSFGAGSSIAHNIFKSPFSGASIYPENETNACVILQKRYIELCKVNPIMDTTKCQQLYKDLELICNTDRTTNSDDPPIKEVW
jgi:hypothetical protein